MAEALDAGERVDGNMAQVIEGGEFGVAFEGEELRDLLKLVEFAIVTTENVGVPVWELGEWKTALEEALTAPRDEEEVAEEDQAALEVLSRKMKILPPESSALRLDDVCECGDTFWRHRKEIAQIGNSPTPETMYFCSNRKGTFVKGEVRDNSEKAPVRAKRREE